MSASRSLQEILSLISSNSDFRDPEEVKPKVFKSIFPSFLQEGEHTSNYVSNIDWLKSRNAIFVGVPDFETKNKVFSTNSFLVCMLLFVSGEKLNTFQKILSETKFFSPIYEACQEKPAYAQAVLKTEELASYEDSIRVIEALIGHLEQQGFLVRRFKLGISNSAYQFKTLDMEDTFLDFNLPPADNGSLALIDKPLSYYIGEWLGKTLSIDSTESTGKQSL
jgi:hypothetical protein